MTTTFFEQKVKSQKDELRGKSKRKEPNQIHSRCFLQIHILFFGLPSSGTTTWACLSFTFRLQRILLFL